MPDATAARTVATALRAGSPRRRVALRWLLTLALASAGLLFWPAAPWVLMWALSASIFTACKWLTWQEGAPWRASVARQGAYVALWPGLDAHGFLESRSARRPRRDEWLESALSLAIGLALVALGVRTLGSTPALVQGWTVMVGIVLGLHFGAFGLLSCAYRHAGFEARPVMRAPLAATSVEEFWGRRWNTAFRDLTSRFVFRPLAARVGVRGALLASFLFSGLLHDLVISVPARGGLGGPTVYFAIQALAVLLERSAVARRTAGRIALGRPWRDRLLALVVLVAPLPLLFHRAFVERVIVPFARVLGGSP